MKHLFIVNPVAGKQKPEDKLRLINEAIDRLLGTAFRQKSAGPTSLRYTSPHPQWMPAGT